MTPVSLMCLHGGHQQEPPFTQRSKGSQGHRPVTDCAYEECDCECHSEEVADAIQRSYERSYEGASNVAVSVLRTPTSQ